MKWVQNKPKATIVEKINTERPGNTSLNILHKPLRTKSKLSRRPKNQEKAISNATY